LIQQDGRPTKSFDDTTRATAFTGSPKGRVTRDGAVLAMTTCLTRMRPLASTREAPVVGGQPASGATTNNPRTQNPTSPAPLSKTGRDMNPCLVWQVGLLWISAVVWQVRERVGRGSGAVQALAAHGPFFWTRSGSRYGRLEPQHRVIGGGPLCRPDASCRFEHPSQRLMALSTAQGAGTYGAALSAPSVD
jgi:hypothetical protein